MVWCPSTAWGGKTKIAFRLRNKIISDVLSASQKNRIHIGSGKISGCEFWFAGENNRISIGNKARISNVKFEVIGSNMEIKIGKQVVLRDSVIHLGDHGSRLLIKDHVDVGSGAKWVILEGKRVQIGTGCMFSTNSHIANSDSHSIVDGKSMKRTNHAEDVVIGDHVWFGEDVTCWKGAHIEAGAIFGSKSFIPRGTYEGNTVYAGIPCKKIKQDVSWKTERIKANIGK